MVSCLPLKLSNYSQKSNQIGMKTTTRILVVLLLVICHFLNTAISVCSSAVFYFVIALLSILSVIQFWKSNKSLKINTPEIVLLAFVIYLVVNNAFCLLYTSPSPRDG